MTRRVVASRTEPHTDCERLGARVRLTLDCGHTKVVKASAAPRRSTRCEICAASGRDE